MSRWGAVLVVVALGAGCGGDDTPSSAPSTSGREATTTVPSADAVALWSELLSELPTDAVSSVITDGDDQWAITAADVVATIWSFDGETWGRAESLDLELPADGLDPTTSSEIITADLTGDGVEDAIVPLVGNGPFATVLSNHDGAWAPIPFAGPVGPMLSIEALRLQGRDLVTYENVCVPSCADGGLDEVTWRFDEASSAFVEDRRVTQVATTVAPPLVPGGPCNLGSDPDCIDPEGDGSGTYLIGGADCMAALSDSPELCSDLDGDGYAGYPDSG